MSESNLGNRDYICILLALETNNNKLTAYKINDKKCNPGTENSYPKYFNSIHKK